MSQVKFCIFESLGTQTRKGTGQIATITEEVKRDTGKTVMATSFAEARREAGKLLPNLDFNKIRVVLAD